MSETGGRRAELEPAQALSLKALVEYQDGTIVSRTIKKNERGTLTAFAFDEGEALSEHTAPFDAFVQVLEGEAEVVIDGQPVAVGEGEIVLMPANIPHAVNARRRFKMLLMMIRG